MRVDTRRGTAPPALMFALWSPPTGYAQASGSEDVGERLLIQKH